MRSRLKTTLRCSGAALLLLLAFALGAGCQQQDGAPMAITKAPDEPDSLVPEELLTQMASFMSSHQEYSFEALVSYESLQESGQKLHFDMIQHVAVSQPDRLFWTTTQDDARIDSAWFDAGLLSVLKQPDNIYGQIDVPNTIPEMIDVATNDYGLIVPFSDILAGGDPPVFLRDVEASLYVGLAWVEGVWSHHVALRNELVDYQLWVRAEGDPVPLKIAITWKLEDGLPSFIARFKKWNFSPAFGESRFHFGERAEAEQIDILPVVSEAEVEL